MIGMLEILTYMLAFYLVVKGIEILQIGLAGSRPKRGGTITLGIAALTACAVAAFYFLRMVNAHVASMG